MNTACDNWQIAGVINDIGHRIQRIREGKGMDAKRVADEVGILHTSYSKIEREGSNSVKTLLKIAKALKVKIADFFEDKLIVSESQEKFGYATKDDFEGLKRAFESFVKSVDERLPPKPTEKAYKTKSKKKTKK